jgi:hypothetical protein
VIRDRFQKIDDEAAGRDLRSHRGPAGGTRLGQAM